MPRYCVLSAPVANNTMPFASRLEPSVVIVAGPPGQLIDCEAEALIGLNMPDDRQPAPKRPTAICGLLDDGEGKPDTESWTMKVVLVLAVICTSQHSEPGGPRC